MGRQLVIQVPGNSSHFRSSMICVGAKCSLEKQGGSNLRILWEVTNLIILVGRHAGPPNTQNLPSVPFSHSISRRVYSYVHEGLAPFTPYVFERKWGPSSESFCNTSHSHQLRPKKKNLLSSSICLFRFIQLAEPPPSFAPSNSFALSRLKQPFKQVKSS